MSEYKLAIIEHYPDGTRWRHFFKTEGDRQATLELLQEAHAGRRYELVGADDASR